MTRRSILLLSRVLITAALLVGFLDRPVSADDEGFGTSTPGGAGKPIVYVTNLNDAGPGSLRAALAQGERTIVFAVGGEIVLSDFLYVEGAFVTIDGFSAPPPGITLRMHGLVIRGTRGAHDVIVRGLRVRDSSIDGIQVSYGAYNVVVDHCSIHGSGDGNLDITGDLEHPTHDVTVSWTVLAHPAGLEKNMLIKYEADRVTLHHNLFVAASQRNPTVAMDDRVMPAVDTTVDMRNNVIWNWGYGVGTVIRNGAWANVVGNYYSSPRSSWHDQAQALIVCAVECGSSLSYPARAYVVSNYSADHVVPNINTAGNEAEPFPAAPVATKDACTAAHEVRAGVGVRPLDALDSAYLAGVTLPPCIPDLAVSALVVPTRTPPGVPFTITDTTRNWGPGGARSVTVDFRLSVDSIRDAADLFVGRRVVPVVDADSASTGSIETTIPVGTRAGLYRVIATVDPDGTTPETNEVNNTRIGYVRVVLPDLVPTNLVAPVAATAGSTIVVSDTIANLGLAAGGPSVARYYLSATPTRGASAVPLGLRDVPALAPRAANPGRITADIPETTRPGTYYIVVEADADAAVTESRENNNARARRITIR